MLSIAIDSSCMTGGVAVLEGQKVLAEYVLSVKRTHSERLMSSLADAMRAADRKPCDIGLISCCTGPGSFTGIRIGVATAKAISLATGAGIAPVTGLEALCYGLPSGDIAWAMIDARHGSCYSQAFSCTGGYPVPITAPGIRHWEAIAASLAEADGRCHLRGDGSLEYGALVAASTKGRVILPSPEDAALRPSKVGMCGLVMMDAGKLVGASDLAPFYIKRPEPEEKMFGE